MPGLQSMIDNRVPVLTPTATIVKVTPNMACYAAVNGPQPRDPPNGRAPPSRPRPPKPPQPRDDGCHRSPSACYGGPQQPQPNKPWPRDPGNGRQCSAGPIYRVASDKQSGGAGPYPPRPPKPPVPRDGGKKGRGRLVMRDPNPRDPGT